MNKKCLWGLILAFLSPIFMLGQNVSIVGKTNVPNALVRLLIYDEMFTRHQTKVAETQSDNEGRFVIKTGLKEVTPAQIAIGLDRVDVILAPNGNYDFEITIPQKTSDKSYFEKESPGLKINKINDGGLYSNYLLAESIIDDFLYENFNLIYRNGRVDLLDTLDYQLNKALKGSKNDYVNDYVKYRLASIEMALNNKKAIAKYLDNQQVLYNQEIYATMLTESLKTIAKDSDFLSRNWQIAEIVQMLNLRNSFYGNPNSKNNIVASLEKLKESSKSAKNQLVATNVIKQISELSYDSDAPAFSLNDKNGNVVKLSDYQEDMVLIQFVDQLTPLAEKELMTLNALHKQWNDTIQLVTIATKESFEEYSQLFDNQGYNWCLLNLESNILLLEDYHVKTYPAYIILKKKNRVGMAPAPSPYHYLDKQVRRISKYL